MIATSTPISKHEVYSYSTGTQPGLAHRHRRRFRAESDDDVDLSMDDSKLVKMRQQKEHVQRQSRQRDLRIMVGLTVWAAYIRLWKIWQPAAVVFDEVHFGGFASKYIKTRFFMDVHPPLAKMLIALVGKLSGFDGDFGFKEIGMSYTDDNVPYLPMRIFCGLAGLLVVPIAYMTMRGAGHSVAAGLVAALMVCYVMDRPFRKWWWIWLTLTGVGLGLTVSSKWVGLFTIATIGTSTVKNLWDILGDTRLPMTTFIRHFFARSICLILIPIMVYMLMFVIHFHSLPNSGEGNGFMSPRFQQSLDGNGMGDTPVDIAYGSKVVLRHIATSGGYLHSHEHDYPGGSNQQQVTLYPHRDSNNDWLITKVNSDTQNHLEYIYDGDIVRLVHVETTKRLHSHDVRPILTDLEYHNEVSGYGFPGFPGDLNDNWRVKIVEHDSTDVESEKRLRALHSRFQLVHVSTGCVLFSHASKLPEWGFEQQEVTCIRDGKLPKTLWYIESNENELLPEDAEKVNYERPGFFAKFLELNQVMWRVNQGLTETHPYDSRPEAWPFLHRGISFWGDDFRHIYLLGNPIVFWASSISIGFYAVVKVISMILQKEGTFSHLGLKKYYDESAGFFVIGWCMHYFPFFIMGRQLFIHHYMPALYFAILVFGVWFDMVVTRLSSRKRFLAVVATLMVVISVYRYFIPITYGEPWTTDMCQAAQWRSTWDFDCDVFHTSLSEYGVDEHGKTNAMIQKAKGAVLGLWRKNRPVEVEGVNIVSDADDNIRPSPSNIENEGPTGPTG